MGRPREAATSHWAGRDNNVISNEPEKGRFLAPKLQIGHQYIIGSVWAAWGRLPATVGGGVRVGRPPFRISPGWELRSPARSWHFPAPNWGPSCGPQVGANNSARRRDSCRRAVHWLSGWFVCVCVCGALAGLSWAQMGAKMSPQVGAAGAQRRRQSAGDCVRQTVCEAFLQCFAVFCTLLHCSNSAAFCTLCSAHCVQRRPARTAVCRVCAVNAGHCAACQPAHNAQSNPSSLVARRQSAIGRGSPVASLAPTWERRAGRGARKRACGPAPARKQASRRRPLRPVTLLHCAPMRRCLGGGRVAQLWAAEREERRRRPVESSQPVQRGPLALETRPLSLRLAANSNLHSNSSSNPNSPPIWLQLSLSHTSAHSQQAHTLSLSLAQ